MEAMDPTMCVYTMKIRKNGGRAAWTLPCLHQGRAESSGKIWVYLSFKKLPMEKVLEDVGHAHSGQDDRN